MTPHLNCIFKPDLLRKPISLDYRYEGVFGSRCPTGDLLRQLGATGKGGKKCEKGLDLTMNVILDVEKVTSLFNLIHIYPNKPFLRRFFMKTSRKV